MDPDQFIPEDADELLAEAEQPECPTLAGYKAQFEAGANTPSPPVACLRGECKHVKKDAGRRE